MAKKPKSKGQHKSTSAQTIVEDPVATKKNVSAGIWLFGICVGAIFLIGIIIRYFAFSNPIAGDEAVYGIIGRKAILGASLYDEVYEMKPPLLFYIYGITSLIFTWGSLGLRLTGLAIAIFNSTLLFKFARIYKDRGISLLIAAVGFFFLNNIYAYAPETAAEHFMTSFILMGYFLLCKPHLKTFNVNIFLAGFLIAGGAMIKQTAALFGLSSIALVVWKCLNEQGSYRKKSLLFNVIYLAIGALSMILLNILPILANGSLEGAMYWLFEVPSSYTSSIPIKESMGYLKIIGGWVIKYQFTTILLAFIATISVFINYKRAYFPVLLILISTSFLAIFPGFRFYGQYWIPLLTLLPLSIISLADLIPILERTALSKSILPLIFLAAISIDSIVHRKQYFERGYLNNAELAHPGIYPSIYFRMSEYIGKTMNPEDSFLMLGSEPFVYYMIDQFPKTKHIFPRSISRNNPVNKIYQAEAIEEMKSGAFDYLMLTVTAKSWQASDDVLFDWYDEVFMFAKSSYEPILAYDIQENRYYNRNQGDEINIYKPFQIIAFKRK